MLYQAQGLPSFSLSHAYKKEEKISKKTVNTKSISKVPANANVITGHFSYKMKTNDEGTP